MHYHSLGCVFKANFLCFYAYFIYYILYIIFLHSATFTPNECLLAIYAKYSCLHLLHSLYNSPSCHCNFYANAILSILRMLFFSTSRCCVIKYTWFVDILSSHLNNLSILRIIFFADMS